MPYTVKGYPTGNNAATGLPWAPATDGLRNITGRVNRDGTVTIWAVTSTVSGSGDQGADPNKVVRSPTTWARSAAGGGELPHRGRPLRRGAPRRVVHPGHRSPLIPLHQGIRGAGAGLSRPPVPCSLCVALVLSYSRQKWVGPARVGVVGGAVAVVTGIAPGSSGGAVATENVPRATSRPSVLPFASV